LQRFVDYSPGDISASDYSPGSHRETNPEESFKGKTIHWATVHRGTNTWALRSV